MLNVNGDTDKSVKQKDISSPKEFINSFKLLEELGMVEDKNGLPHNFIANGINFNYVGTPCGFMT